MPKTTEYLTCSRVLALTLFFCFVLQYMPRINIAMAITEMTTKNATSSSQTFNWTETEKHVILSIFFFGYIIFSAPGGRLSEIYGTKKVMGISTLTAGILTLLTPIASSLHQYAVMVIRLLTGVALGVAFPALPPLVSKWVPVENRSKFISHAAAASLGAVITWPICGFLIAHLGWPSVFYFTGAILIVFSLIWFYLIYDSPSEHPRISKNELLLLLKEVTVATCVKTEVPWKKLLTSGPVWAIVLSATCFSFSWYFILTELPTYMKTVLKYNIKENGALSSIPYLVNYFASVASCFLADKWIKSNTFSIITTRRIFVAMTSVVPAFFFLIQSFWGFNRIVSIVIFTLFVGFKGCYTSGFFSNSLDIAPTFSGTICGITVACASLAGFLSIILLGFILKENQDFGRWQCVFWILAGVDVIGGLLYFFLSSGDVQSWNPKRGEADEDRQEMKINALNNE